MVKDIVKKTKDYDLKLMTGQKPEKITENNTFTEYSPAEVEKTGPETKNGIIVNALFVNVRREPDYESEMVELLRKSDRVVIVGKVGEFYKVNTSVNRGVYISSNFIKEE